MSRKNFVHDHVQVVHVTIPREQRSERRQRRIDLLERVERCRRFGSVTPQGIVYDECLDGPDGMCFTLFPNAGDDLKAAKAWLRDTRDVTHIYVERVS